MTTMTSSQLAWKQFTASHIQREDGADERRDLADDREDRFDAPVPVPVTASKSSKTSTTSTISTKSKRIQFSTTGYLINNNRSNLTAAIVATTVAISPVAGFEQVKKAKTRSERRAEEPEVKPEPEKHVARKERRSDYWIHRDDLRRNNTRILKTQFQEIDE